MAEKKMGKVVAGVVMKQKMWVAFIGILLVCAGNLSAQMTKTQLQNMYMTYLQEQGYQPSVDSDGDVQFKAERGNYYIYVDERDLQSFMIIYPNFWEIESPAEKAQVYEVVNYINRTTKVAKVYMNSRGDDVSMNANIFIQAPEDFKLHFRRMLNLLIAERREFAEKMNE